jgi:predicted nucleic acid-binding protein
MAKLLLDSDILIYFLKGRKEVVEQVAKYTPDDLLTSRINYTELLYGAYNSVHTERNLRTIVPFLDNFEILEFDKVASEIFAKEKARLKKSGTMIADMDLMIASIAIANGIALVSNNTKHFERIKGLTLVRWIEVEGSK